MHINYYRTIIVKLNVGCNHPYVYTCMYCQFLLKQKLCIANIVI